MDSLDFSVENLEKVIQLFYSQKAAPGQNEFLTAAQVSTEAWTFAWELLDKEKPFAVQFFAAGTLYTKIAKYWHEIPTDHYGLLKKKLLDYITIYASGPPVVLMRLCTALSAYIIHTTTDHWKNAVGELVEYFVSGHANATCLPVGLAWDVLLQILLVLPEEFAKIHLVQSRKSTVRNELQRSTQLVLPLLNEVLISSERTLDNYVQATGCVTSWVQFGTGILLPETEPLVQLLIRTAQNDQLSEKALEALTSLVTQPDSHKYPSSLERILSHILQLENFLQISLNRGLLDVACSVYSLLIGFAESHSRLILEFVLEESEKKQNSIKLIQLILQCSATPGQYPLDETCSVLPFGFWFILQDDIIASESEDCMLYMKLFSPIYQALVNIMLDKSSYPSHNTTWSADDKESFRCYRQDVADTLTYCYSILRDNLLEILNHHLETSISICQDNQLNWQPLEACLHAFNALAEPIGSEENAYISKFISMLPTIPFNNNLHVISSTLHTIGAYSEWISCHSEVLPQMIPLLILGLSDSQVAQMATLALKDLSRDCQTHMQPFASDILTASQQSLTNGILKPEECIRLMYVVGKVLSTLPVDNIMNYLNHMLMPFVEQLRTLSQQTPSATSKALLLIRLKMIATLFTTLDLKLPKEENEECNKIQISNLPQPVLPVLREILPVLQSIAQAWHKDYHIIEVICCVLKQAISTLMDDCLPVVPDTVQFLLKVYQTHPHPSVLEVSKLLLLMFGDDANGSVVSMSLLGNLCNITLNHCHANLADNTDVLEGFFQMMASLLKKNPKLIAQGDINLTDVVQCGIASLGLAEAPTVKASSSFLVQFISHSTDFQSFSQILQLQGEELITQIIRCIGGSHLRGVLDHLAEILLILNKKQCSLLSRWLQDVLKVHNFPTHHVNMEQKQQFASIILRERANKRKVQETVKKFTLSCRGILGTEYGVQISSFL